MKLRLFQRKAKVVAPRTVAPDVDSQLRVLNDVVFDSWNTAFLTKAAISLSVLLPAWSHGLSNAQQAEVESLWIKCDMALDIFDSWWPLE